jgi:hypothetical protein
MRRLTSTRCPEVDFEAIIELTTVLLQHVEIQLAEEKAKVLAIVKGMSLEDILADSTRPLAGTALDPLKTRRSY